MRTHVILWLIILMLARVAHGQENPHRAEYQRLVREGKRSEAADYLERVYPEYDFKKIRGLAIVVDSASEAKVPRANYIYNYQLKILDAARVNIESDSETELAKKVSGMWKVCDELDLMLVENTKFDVPNGSLIKFAVCLKFDEFITDVVDWKVDLNKVDAADGRTVMDYLLEHIKRSEGLPYQKSLEKYYEKLRKAGGKHRIDLK